MRHRVVHYNVIEVLQRPPRVRQSAFALLFANAAMSEWRAGLYRHPCKFRRNRQDLSNVVGCFPTCAFPPGGLPDAVPATIGPVTVPTRGRVPSARCNHIWAALHSLACTLKLSGQCIKS